MSIFLICNIISPNTTQKTGILASTKLKSNTLAKYTYISYVCADNNLENYGMDDVNEMEAGFNDSVTDVNVITLLDVLNGGTKAYYISHDDQPNTITSTILTVEGLASEVNMGDPNTLFKFVNWCITYYPAEKYVLDLWDHGSGWAICFDESSGDDALTMAELRSVLETINETTGNKIDILSMDACLMGTFEVAYELHDLVSILISSEDTILAVGFPYDTIIEDLCADPDQNITEFAITTVNLFHDSMLYWSSTLAAINLTILKSNLFPSFEVFSQNLFSYLDTGIKNEIYNARGASQEFYHPEFIDLYDFIYHLKQEASNITIQQLAQDVLDNITASMIIEKHHSNPGAHGLSIYFPELQGAYIGAYSSYFSLTNETMWDDFLEKYYTSANFGLGLRYYSLNDTLGDGDDTPDAGETISIEIVLENIGEIDGEFINSTFICLDTENVTILDGMKQYGDIVIGGNKAKTFSFNISVSCVNFTVLPFVILTESIFGSYLVVRNFTLELIVGLEVTLGGATLQSASEVSIGFIYGILPGPGTEREAWLKINCTKDSYLFLNLTGPILTDFDAYVYDPDQDLVSIAGKANYPDACSFLLMKDGYYYIKIDPFSGFGYYTLFLNFTSEPYEDGSFFGLAFTLTENSIANGSLPGPASNSYIYYRVIVEANQRLTVILHGPIGTDFDMYIYNPKIQQVDRSTSPYSSESCSLMARYTGYYYIVIVPYQGSGDFTLEVEIKEISFPNWLIYLLVILIVSSIVIAIAYYFLVIRRQRGDLPNYNFNDLNL